MANIPFLNNAYFSAKVGIGTDGPAYKLDVNSSASVGARIESTGSGYAPASILLEAGGNDARGQGIYQYNIASKNSWFSGVPYSTTSDDWIIAHKLETTAFNSDVAQMSNALFCVNDNGNVGIGTTSPSANLDILNGTTGASLKLSATATAYWQLQRNSTTGNLNISDDALGNVMSFDQLTGNVGIGTDSPDNILHVRNGDTGYASQVGADTMLILETTNVSNSLQFSSTTSGNQYIMFGDDDPNAGWIAYAHSDNSFSFRTNGAERMRIATDGAIQFNDYGAGTLVSDASGNITASSGGGAGGPYLPLSAGSSYPLTNSLYIGSSGANGLILKQDTSAGSNSGRLFFQTDTAIEGVCIMNANGTLSFRTSSDPGATSGNTKMVLTNSGNVGIGSTSPGAKLEVAGDILINSGEYISWGTVGATSIEGSTASNKLQFRTNSSDRMIIDSSGNVGIGTTSPGQKLHLNNSATLTPTYQKFTNGTATTGTTLGIDADGDFIINNGEAKEIKLYTNDSQRVTIQSGGNVGIGTTSPRSRLEVDGQILISNTFPALDFVDTNSFTDVNDRFRVRAGGDQGLIQWYDDSNSSLLTLMTLNPNGNVIVPNGNVGIGTSSPDRKLQVKGSVALDVMPGHQTEGTIRIGRYDNNTSRYNDIQSYVSSTASQNYLRFSIHNGVADSTIDVMSIKGSGYVGIGTISPNAMLDIHKNDDTVYDPSADDGQRSIGATIQLNNNSTVTNTFGQIMHDTDSSGQAIARMVFLDAGSSSSAIAFVTEDGNQKDERLRIAPNGNVGIGTNSPSSKLQVDGGIQMADDTDAASADKVGTLKYRVSGNNSYVDMCMQTGATTYTWINIVQNNW